MLFILSHFSMCNMSESYVIQIVGYSQTGKTTLLEKLIEILIKKNFTILAIKSAQTHSYDYSTKDSDRFLRAGAQASAVFFKNLIQLSFSKQNSPELEINKIIKTFNYDFVFVEGFKDLSFPKILTCSEKFLDSNILDYNTIRYLYCPQDMQLNINKTIKTMIEEDKIVLFRNVEQLASSIIHDLESG